MRKREERRKKSRNVSSWVGCFGLNFKLRYIVTNERGLIKGPLSDVTTLRLREEQKEHEKT